MSISDVSSRQAVLSALEEFDSLGEQEFLQRHGYGRALRWVLVHEQRPYPSKAILGVAYSKQFPDRTPLAETGRFTGGEHTVVKKLRELGFTVEPRGDAGLAADGVRVWIVRAGRDGRHEQLALDQDVVAIGWSEIGPLSPTSSREDLKQLVRDTYGEEREPSVAAQAGQLYRFIHDIQDGDLVVLPLLATPGHVAVGRVLGPYRHRTDGPFADADAQHTRPVEWLAEPLPYARFASDLRAAFGQQGTVSEISKPDAARRVLALVAAPEEQGMHVLLRVPAAQGPDTIEDHRALAAARGATWLGKLGDPAGRAALADAKLAVLQGQLADDVPTHVFLHRTGEIWRTRLLDVRRERPDAEAELIPAAYRETLGEHHLWLKLADFQRLPETYAESELILDGSSDPASVAKAFRGQTALLYVRQRLEEERAARVWWVNQGQSFGQELAGGYLSAPRLTEGGTQRADWDALTLAVPGDRALSYVQGVIRAIGTIVAGTDESAELMEGDEADDLRRVQMDYRVLDQPVPLERIPQTWRVQEGGPFNRHGAVKQGYFFPLSDAFAARLSRTFPQLELGLSTPTANRLTVEAVRETAEAERYGLELSARTYAAVIAALESRKHVILTGPPGTAKTTLAQAIAETAQRIGLCDGYLLTTATADWTTYETIGGLRPTSGGELTFELGHFLKAIEDRQWLVIDELNRSQLDRAFGQLFTVLSGQAVTLPYTRAGARAPLTLLPEGSAPPAAAADVLEIPREWRIVATMNVFDKSLLFEMSYALMRRFAFIEVPSPSTAIFEGLIERWAEGSDEAVDTARALLAVRAVKDIGPAVFGDVARFAAQRLRLGEVTPQELRFQAFYSYLLPQFEGISDAAGARLYEILRKATGTRFDDELRATLTTVLGLELPGSGEANGGVRPDGDTALDE